MTTTFRQWSGDEWQDYCLQLLSLRYGHGDLQRVPSRHRGDLGIEAYSRDGCLYQCYAAHEPPSSDQLYPKQRNKITEDLGKLGKNSDGLVRLLGELKIRRYVFMFPDFGDKRLAEHATKKSEEVRSARLPFIADDFEVQVVTDEDFPIERATLMSKALVELNIELPDVTEEQVGDWLGKNTSAITNLNDKLGKVPTLQGSKKTTKMRGDLLRFFLAGEDILQKLRSNYPKTWEKVGRLKNSRETFLEASNALLEEAPNTRLTRVVREFTKELCEEVRELDRTSVEHLSWHAVADWLMRCPLDFD